MESTIWNLEDARKYHIHSEGLAHWLRKNLSRHFPVIDFGCGPAYYLSHLHDEGFTVEGYEGTPGINDIAFYTPIHVADITEPIDSSQGHVLCLEVMEHISADKEEAALQNITNACSHTLVLSWAVPGQPGHGHINCRTPKYVIDKLGEYGFHVNFLQTIDARAAAITNPHTRFFGDTLYIFNRV